MLLSTSFRNVVNSNNYNNTLAYLAQNPTMPKHVPDQDNTSLLSYLIFNYSIKLEAIKALIQSPQNFILNNNQNVSPLHLAAQENLVSVCQWLLAKDPTLINQQDNKGNTPLHYAVHHTDNDLIVAQLLLSGANKNILNINQQTAKQIANTQNKPKSDILL